MTKKTSIQGTAEAWETGALGRSDAHARVASQELTDQINEALGLQAISIRLPKTTIDAYKNLAAIHGVGYQPLMRDAICRWAESEMKMLLAGAVESQRVAAKSKPVRSKLEQSKAASAAPAEATAHEDTAPPMKKAA